MDIDIDIDVKNTFDTLILKYLDNYQTITKQQIIDLSVYQPRVSNIKIINNILYFNSSINDNKWETRRESLKYLLLETLKKYNIPDCEFVIAYHDDSINYSNLIPYNLPLIVSTSCSVEQNYILCPDFTFTFAPEYNYKNHYNMCLDVVEQAEKIHFKYKKNKIVWRGSNSHYRTTYMRLDNLYDIQIVQGITKTLGEESNTFSNPNSLSRKDKLYYKYHLYLNGHNGNKHDGAYSSAFKWSLMCNSLTFYCAPDKFKEFWMDETIFEENNHYVYCKDKNELHSKLIYYTENEIEAEKIAKNGFDFFKKYLLDYDNIKYYMFSLLNNYSKRLNYKVELNNNDVLIRDINYSAYLHS